MNLNSVAVFRYDTSRIIDKKKVIVSSNDVRYISTYLIYSGTERRVLKREWQYFVNNCDNYSDAALRYFLNGYSDGQLVDILYTLVHNDKITELKRISSYVKNRDYTCHIQSVMQCAIKNRNTRALAVLLKYYPKLDPSYQSSRFRTSYIYMARKEGNCDLMKILLTDKRVRDKIEELRPYDLLQSLKYYDIEEGLYLIDKYTQ